MTVVRISKVKYWHYVAGEGKYESGDKLDINEL